MFPLFTRKKMSGGLVFGPPGWQPARIEDTFDVGDPSAGSLAPRASTKPHGSKSRIDNPELPGLISLLERIGLTASSSFTPSLLDQLRALPAPHPRALILNFLPAQPEFALASALTRLAFMDLVSGLELLQSILEPGRVILALDRHDHKSARLWKRHARGKGLSRRPLLNRYPQAHPTILIRSLTGNRLSVGRLPTARNLLVVDTVSLWALGRYLRTGEPFTSRPVQLFTQYMPPAPPAPPRLVIARVGESIADFAGRFNVTIAGKEIILNGMLAGRVVTPDSPITIDTDSISIREPTDPELSSPCIACGWCVDVCPTALNPVQLMQIAEKIAPSIGISASAPQAAARIPLPLLARESLHCIACGLCSYVCPTRLPLMQETLRLRAHVLASTANAGENAK